MEARGATIANNTIAARARLENSLGAPNNTALHLEREDRGLKAGVY
jgi:hypothetical protein